MIPYDPAKRMQDKETQSSMPLDRTAKSVGQSGSGEGGDDRAQAGTASCWGRKGLSSVFTDT